MTYEPRFDLDNDYGGQGELYVGDTLRALRNGAVQIEVKRKRRLDNRFYIELEQYPGRRGLSEPSGLHLSQAEIWAFVIADTGVVLFVPASRLRAAIFELDLGRDVRETDGSNPTIGRLLSFSEIIAPVIDAVAR